MTHETKKLDRRTVIGSAISVGFFAGIAPSVALALTEAASKALVDKIVGEINRVIASGKSESAMIGDFERIFARYADVPIIARSALGADSRRASQAQLRAFSGAFQGYVARKYGKRFREFIGGEIQVQGVRRSKNYHEVEATVFLRGESPFEVLFLVYERGGKNLFFDMVIEGVSMRIVERTEIGSMLDANNGDIDSLINAVQRAG
ncbi:MAG: ABC transporter substrate-binding protein [Pseudomonadota bacterium]